MTHSLLRPLLLAFACALLPRIAAAQDLDETEVRTKKLLDLKRIASDLGDHAFETLDGAPAAPFMICMEKSPSYNAQLMLDAFRGAMTSLYKLFKERFGDLYDAKSFEAGQACLIYVFETRVRYTEVTRAPVWSGGAFDPSRGALILYKDTSQLYETLFREGSRQLLATIARSNDGKSGAAADPTLFWLSHGVGTYFECFKRDAKGGFELGKVSQQYMPFVGKLVTDGKLRKLEDLLKITSEEFAKRPVNNKETMGLFCEAWAFWHFMQTANGGAHRKKLDAYAKLALLNKGGFEAVKECFGDLEALNAEYVEFVKAQK